MNVAAQELRRARRPLLRNAYALVVNAAATSVLGLGYWVLAARRYPVEDVGRGSAAIATMTLLATFATLNLPGALNRYLPRAGTGSAGLVRSAYLLGGALAAVASLTFVLGLGVWAPSLGFLRASPGMALFFCAATVTWTVFSLQDGVLTGLRQAVWVPVENISFGVAKIVLLLVLAAAAPGAGVFASWAIPMAVLLVPVNLLIFRRLLPGHVRETSSRPGEPVGLRLIPRRVDDTGDRPSEPVGLREVGTYLAGDSAGTMAVFASTAVLPALVVSRFGPAANAYFWVAVTTSIALNLLAINMGMSLTVEGSHTAAGLTGHLRVAVRHTAWLLAPVVAGGVLLAPAILSVFGPAYAREGTGLFRLMVLAALPKAVLELHLGFLRAQGRSRRIAALQAVQAAVFLALVLALIDRVGIAGIGWAYLASNLLVAVPLVPRLWRMSTA